MIVLFAIKIKNKYENANYESLRCLLTVLEIPPMGVY